MDKSNDAPRFHCSFLSVLVVVESDLVVGCLRIESKARGAAVARRLTGLRMVWMFQKFGLMVTRVCVCLEFSNVMV